MDTELRNDGVVFIDQSDLRVWLRRPDCHPTNWWIAFISSDRDLTYAWNLAFQQCRQEYGLSRVFHQGIWPEPAHGCGEFHHENCEDTVHAWEIWEGCSALSLAFPDASLEDLLLCGDDGLEQVMGLLPCLEDDANRIYASLGV